MALALTYPTKADAERALQAEGFSPGSVPYWTKRSMTGGNLIEAPRACVAVVEIKPQYVAPEYGGGCYFELRFH